MALERKSPDALLEQANLSGAVTAIQDDPDTPDANWLTAVSNNADSICRVSFPTPTGSPTVGANLQEFKIWVRKMGGTGTPTVRIELYENNVFLATLLADTNVTSTSGVLHSGTWNANLLGTADGSLVECRVYGTKSGGSPTARAALEVGAVEWNVDYGAGVTNYQFIPAVSIGVGVLGKASTLYRTLTSTAIGTAVLTTAKMFAKALDAVVTGVASLAVIKTLMKSLSSTAIGVAELLRITTIYKALAPVATGAASVVKGLYQSLTATALGTTVLSTVTTFYRSLVASAAGSPLLMIIRTAVQSLAVVATGITGLTKLVTYYRTLTSTATGVGVVSKISSFYQGLAATAIGSALLSKVTTFKKALASAVTGIANLATQFIAGGGGQTFYKTLSATATAVTSLLFTLNRILKVHTKTSISADLNMTSTRAALGTITSTIKHPLKLTSTITEK